MDALASLSLLNVPWGLLESWFSLKTKAAITTPVCTHLQAVSILIQNTAALLRAVLSALAVTKSNLMFFSSVHVYIQRTWQPASFSFMVISCYRPSFLNITLEFHLKGRKHWECQNVVCLMNKTREKCLNGCINALFFVTVPLYILCIISNTTWFLLYFHNAPLDLGGILSHFVLHLKVEGKMRPVYESVLQITGDIIHWHPLKKTLMQALNACQFKRHK